MSASSNDETLLEDISLRLLSLLAEYYKWGNEAFVTWFQLYCSQEIGAVENAAKVAHLPNPLDPWPESQVVKGIVADLMQCWARNNDAVVSFLKRTHVPRILPAVALEITRQPFSGRDGFLKTIADFLRFTEQTCPGVVNDTLSTLLSAHVSATDRWCSQWLHNQEPLGGEVQLFDTAPQNLAIVAEPIRAVLQLMRRTDAVSLGALRLTTGIMTTYEGMLDMLDERITVSADAPLSQRRDQRWLSLRRVKAVVRTHMEAVQECWDDLPQDHVFKLSQRAVDVALREPSATAAAAAVLLLNRDAARRAAPRSVCFRHMTAHKLAGMHRRLAGKVKRCTGLLAHTHPAAAALSTCTALAAELAALDATSAAAFVTLDVLDDAATVFAALLEPLVAKIYRFLNFDSSPQHDEQALDFQVPEYMEQSVRLMTTLLSAPLQRDVVALLPAAEAEDAAGGLPAILEHCTLHIRAALWDSGCLLPPPELLQKVTGLATLLLPRLVHLACVCDDLLRQCQEDFTAELRPLVSLAVALLQLVAQAMAVANQGRLAGMTGFAPPSPFWHEMNINVYLTALINLTERFPDATDAAQLQQLFGDILIEHRWMMDDVAFHAQVVQALTCCAEADACVTSLDALLFRLPPHVWCSPDAVTAAILDVCIMCDAPDVAAEAAHGAATHCAAVDGAATHGAGASSASGTVWVRQRSQQVPHSPSSDLQHLIGFLLARLGDWYPVRTAGLEEEGPAECLMPADVDAKLLCMHGMHRLLRFEGHAFGRAVLEMEEGAEDTAHQLPFYIMILLMAGIASRVEEPTSSAETAQVARRSHRDPPDAVFTRFLGVVAAFLQELLQVAPQLIDKYAQLVEAMTDPEL